jgi:hypothetical protein
VASALLGDRQSRRRRLGSCAASVRTAVCNDGAALRLTGSGHGIASCPGPCPQAGLSSGGGKGGGSLGKVAATATSAVLRRLGPTADTGWVCAGSDIQITCLFYATRGARRKVYPCFSRTLRRTCVEIELSSRAHTFARSVSLTAFSLRFARERRRQPRRPSDAGRFATKSRSSPARSASASVQHRDSSL